MTTRWSKSRLSDRHRAVMGWTLLCAGAASFVVALQALQGLVA